MRRHQIDNIVCHLEAVTYPCQQVRERRIAYDPIHRLCPCVEISPALDLTPLRTGRQEIQESAAATTWIETRSGGLEEINHIARKRWRCIHQIPLRAHVHEHWLHFNKV